MGHEQHLGSRFVPFVPAASIISINTFITAISQGAPGISCRNILQLRGSGNTCMIDRRTDGRVANPRNDGGVLRHAPRGTHLTSRRNTHPDTLRTSECLRYQTNTGHRMFIVARSSSNFRLHLGWTRLQIMNHSKRILLGGLIVGCYFF